MRLPLLGLALLACAPETRLTEDTFRVEPTLPDACMELSRERLALLARVHEQDEASVTVSSTCEGVLELRSIRLETGEPISLEQPRDLTVEGGFFVEIGVVFSPLVEGTWTDRLFIETNDPDLPTAEVVITAETR